MEGLPMTGFKCPVCGEKYKADGAPRDHAWSVHGMWHYCEGFRQQRDTVHPLLIIHDVDLSCADHKRADTEVDTVTVSDRLVPQGPWTAVTGLSQRSLLIASRGALAGGTTTVSGAFSRGLRLAPSLEGGERDERRGRR